MDQPLKVILIGAGAMGRSWLSLITSDPHWEIAALVDVASESLATAGNEFGVPPERRFADARVAIEQIPADAAMVVTPPETHRAVAMAALERGLPVFCEKPLAASLRDGVALLSAARARKLPLMVGQGRRWLPHIEAMRAAVAAGLIGTPGYLTCQFRIPFRFGGWRETMPEVLIEDLAIHHLDSIRFITGRNGRQISAHSFRPAWSWYSGNTCAAIDLELEGGLPVHYFGSWVARGPRSSWDGELIVVGAEGALMLREDETVWHYRDEEEAPTQLPLPELQPAGMARGLDIFARAVRGLGPPMPDAEDNIHSLALTAAAVASTRSNRPVDIQAHLREAGWNPQLRPESRLTS